MLNNHKIIIDFQCEIYDLIRNYADEDFYDLTKHTIIPGAIYIVGRQQFTEHKDYLIQLVKDKVIHLIFSNPHEGSETILVMHPTVDFGDLTNNYSFKVIVGGDLPPNIDFLQYESFLPRVLDFQENITAVAEYAAQQSSTRPYKFLFLNGRLRPHRNYLLNYFNSTGLLNEILWSNLDNNGTGPYYSLADVIFNNIKLKDSTFPVKYLPPAYEVAKYQQNAVKLPDVITAKFEARNQLFNNEWGDIYLAPKPYLDTYFSLVTETVFDYPHSFRTEKIYKPIAIGHPFIVASNPGYYRDLQNLGFKTFGHLIDESFDTIDNGLDRIKRITAVVEDLCDQDLPAFITAAQETCKYNQQRMSELRHKVRQEFPQRFEQYINERFRI